MYIKIYQIDMSKDTANRAFRGIDEICSVEKISSDDFFVDWASYRKVFEGDVDCADLEDVYVLLNTRKPKGFSGHLLSVSDIVAVKNADDGTFTYAYVDSIGYKEVDGTDAPV